MTPEQAAVQMRAIFDKRQVLHAKIATAARAVVPVLLDAARANSAAELQQLFFELDANEQGVNDLMAAHPEATVGGLLAMIEGRRRS